MNFQVPLCVCVCVHVHTRIVNRPSEDRGYPPSEDKVQSETAVCYQSKAAKLVNNNEIKGLFLNLLLLHLLSKCIHSW